MADIIVSSNWTTVLAATETTGTVFRPVGTGEYQASYQSLGSSGSAILEVRIDNVWVRTGDVVSGSDAGVSSGEAIFTLDLRHGDQYRFTTPTAGPVVKLALVRGHRVG